MTDAAELAFVATMRDEASREAKGVRQAIDRTTGTTRPIETPVRVRDEARRTLAGISADLDKFGDKATRAGRKMTLGLTLPIVGAGAASVKLEADYDKTMRQVAIATDGPIDKLDALAKKLGADTQFSAGEASQAMLELAKGGMSAATIQGGALEAAMTLAAAGGTDLASASTYVSNGLAVFGLDAKEAERVTVALAGAANASSASVQSLGEGLSQSALAAKNTGLSIEETAGALSLFDAMGLKGSDAGTSFKTMLASLLPQTTKQKNAMKDLGLSFVDSEGHFDDLGTVAEKLHDRLGGLTDAQKKQALMTIFGSDGIRAATILTDGGRKSVEKYTKAAKDQKTTQELANAAMEGTSGALERAQGSIETAGLAFGEVLAPYVEDAAGAVEALSGWLADLDPSAQKAVVGVAAVTAAAGPLLVGVGSMARGLSSTIDLMARLKTNSDAAGGGISLMGKRAKIAAGVGGLAALAGSAAAGDGATSQLLGTLGGAATGFAIGGPVGAAVGALGGYISTSGDATQAQKDLAAAQQVVTDTLNAQTGAFTKKTKQDLVTKLGEEGVLQRAKDLNIDLGKMVTAIMSGSAALTDWQIALVNAAPDEERASIVGLTSDLLDHSEALAGGQAGWLLEAEAMGKGGKAAVQTRGLMNSLRDELGLMPKQVKTLVEAKNAGKTRGEVRALLKQYGMAPDEIQTAIDLLGVPVTKRKTEEISNALRGVGKVKPNLGPWLADYGKALTGGKQKSVGKIAETNRAIRDETSKAKPQLDPFIRALTGDLNSLTIDGRTGGSQIGTAIGSGTSTGIGSMIAQVAAQARAMVRAAIAAARAEAKAKSPSRETYDLGQDLGDGASLGIDSKRGQVAASGAAMARAAIHGFEDDFAIGELIAALTGDNATDKVEKVLGGLDGVIEAFYRRRFKGQKNAEEKAAKASKAALKALRQETTAIKKHAKDREKIAAQLAAAYEQIDPKKFKAMGDEFRDQMRDAASLLNFEPVNGAPITADFLQQHLQAQLAAIQTYVANLAALRGKVSDSILKQLEAAGYEQGGAYAAALAAATPEQLAAINASQAAIDAATQAAGNDMGDHWHDVAVEATAGLIAGLESQLDNLDKIGRKLARKIRRALLDELGIKSPSRVLRADFRKGGRGVGDGLLDSIPYAEQAARTMAARVGAAAQVDASALAVQAATVAGVSASIERTVRIEHVVTSPDGSVSTMTAEEVADLIARDPKSAAVLDRALARPRTRRASQTVSASDSTV